MIQSFDQLDRIPVKRNRLYLVGVRKSLLESAGMCHEFFRRSMWEISCRFVTDKLRNWDDFMLPDDDSRVGTYFERCKGNSDLRTQRSTMPPSNEARHDIAHLRSRLPRRAMS